MSMQVYVQILQLHDICMQLYEAHVDLPMSVPSHAVLASKTVTPAGTMCLCSLGGMIDDAKGLPAHHSAWVLAWTVHMQGSNV